MELLRKALNVVLQNWMVLDLGWYPNILESQLPNLRHDILELRMKFSNPSSAKIHRETFLQSLSMDGFFMDKDWLRLLKSELEDFNERVWQARFLAVSVTVTHNNN
jgi:hypothetical protein